MSNNALRLVLFCARAVRKWRTDGLVASFASVSPFRVYPSLLSFVIEKGPRGAGRATKRATVNGASI